ncbi:MAG: beta-propeller fold lactonase family protein [Microbacterium sp.]|uniref:lactonase family protein n=1 Tax=Microbacterium sp. TaxID=51671 RepID=UPI0039E32996
MSIEEPLTATKTFAYIGQFERFKEPIKDAFTICDYDERSGAVRPIEAKFPGISVSSTYLDTARRVLYATDEGVTYDQAQHGYAGRVFAFRIDPVSGDLEEINHSPSYGSLPSSSTLDPTGRFLLVTHHTDRVPITRVEGDRESGFRVVQEYDAATLVLFAVGEDGAIGAPLDVVTFMGTGGAHRVQTHPQLHAVVRSPSGGFYVICDKGEDRIYTVAIDEAEGRIRLLNGETGFATVPGASPRGFAFHPTEPYLYVNFQTRSVIGVYRYDEQGGLEEVQVISSLPDGQPDSFTFKQADIRFHPSGRFLYSSVRGLNGISVFGVDGETGRLTHLETIPLAGDSPRGCAISPDGRFMLVGTRYSNELWTYRIEEDGHLSPVGEHVEVASPGNITFFTAPAGR